MLENGNNRPMYRQTVLKGLDIKSHSFTTFPSPEPRLPVSDSVICIRSNNDRRSNIPGGFVHQTYRPRFRTIKLPDIVSGQHALEGPFASRFISACRAAQQGIRV